jgi:hypothetical protein
MRLSTNVLVVAMAVGATAQDVKSEDRPDEQAGWDREKAAQYLDARMDMWFEQATRLTTSHGKTS